MLLWLESFCKVVAQFYVLPRGSSYLWSEWRQPDGLEILEIGSKVLWWNLIKVDNTIRETFSYFFEQIFHLVIGLRRLDFQHQKTFLVRRFLMLTFSPVFDLSSTFVALAVWIVRLFLFFKVSLVGNFSCFFSLVTHPARAAGFLIGLLTAFSFRSSWVFFFIFWVSGDRLISQLTTSSHFIPNFVQVLWT